MTKTLFYVISTLIYATIAVILFSIPEMFNLLSVQIGTLCFVLIPPILFYVYNRTRTEEDLLDENYYEEETVKNYSVKKVERENFGTNRTKVKVTLRNGQELEYNDTVSFPEDKNYKDKFSVKLSIPYCGGVFVSKMEHFKNTVSEFLNPFTPIQAGHAEYNWIYQFVSSEQELKDIARKILVECLGFKCTPEEENNDVYTLSLVPHNTKIGKNELALTSYDNNFKSIRSLVAVLWTDCIKSSSTQAESMVKLPMGEKNLEIFKKALEKSKLTVEDLMKKDQSEVLEFFKKVVNGVGFENELFMSIKIDLSKVSFESVDCFDESGSEFFKSVIGDLTESATLEAAFCYENASKPGTYTRSTATINNSIIGINVC